MASAYVKDDQGGTFIPASQRPDGTWRKPRRVKDGYVPQEEVPLYESKGKQFTKNKSMYPPGASPEFIAEHKAKLESMAMKPKTIPGLEVKSDTKKKKKKNKNKTVEILGEEVSKISVDPTNQAVIESPTPAVAVSVDKVKNINKTPKLTNSKKSVNASSSSNSLADPEKRLKNLRKKIREIEVLEEKISSGNMKNPIKEILDKVDRKSDILKEIDQLEKIY